MPGGVEREKILTGRAGFPTCGLAVEHGRWHPASMWLQTSAGRLQGLPKIEAERTGLPSHVFVSRFRAPDKLPSRVRNLS